MRSSQSSRVQFISKTDGESSGLRPLFSAHDDEFDLMKARFVRLATRRTFAKKKVTKKNHVLLVLEDAGQHDLH